MEGILPKTLVRMKLEPAWARKRLEATAARRKEQARMDNILNGPYDEDDGDLLGFKDDLGLGGE